jgi:hypothetical protein
MLGDKTIEQIARVVRTGWIIVAVMGLSVGVCFGLAFFQGGDGAGADGALHTSVAAGLATIATFVVRRARHALPVPMNRAPGGSLRRSLVAHLAGVMLVVAALPPAFPRQPEKPIDPLVEVPQAVIAPVAVPPAPAEPQGSPPPTAPHDWPRSPVPDRLDEARPLVRQAFGKELSKLHSEPDLSIRALVDAALATEKPANRYAIFEAAIDAASDAAGKAIREGSGADWTTPQGAPIRAAVLRVTSLIDQLAAEFEIDGFARRLDAFDKLLPPKRSPPRQPEDGATFAGLFEQTIETADLAWHAFVPASASKAARMADRIADRMKEHGRSLRAKVLVTEGDAMRTRTKELTARIEDREKAIAAYEQAAATLRADPRDPVANGVVGRHHCFRRGRWQQGLPLLAASDNRAIQEAAKLELHRFGPKNPNYGDLFDLAGKWWDIGDREGGKEDGTLRDEIRHHASLLYRYVATHMPDPVDARLATTRSSAPTAARNASRATSDRLLSLNVAKDCADVWRMQWVRKEYTADNTGPFEPIERTPRLVVARRAFGETDVFFVHPVDKQTPTARVGFGRMTSATAGRLWFRMRNQSTGDTVAAITIQRGDTKPREVFHETLGGGTWRTVVVPFDHESVTLIVEANGWHAEGLWLTYQFE